MKTYTVEVTAGMRLVTLYDGKSRDKAADTVDNARITLIVGKGTGAVTLRASGVADVVWSVQDGEASLALIGGAADAAMKAKEQGR